MEKAVVEMEPTPDKIEALLEMERPNPVRQAQQVLGMVNQLSRWVPRLSLSIPNLKKFNLCQDKISVVRGIGDGVEEDDGDAEGHSEVEPSEHGACLSSMPEL